MSGYEHDDDGLDEALRALGAPAGAEPHATAGELLARAGVPAAPGASAPTARPNVTPATRFGLSGVRLAAAVIGAVGLGFGGGLLVAGRGSSDAEGPAPDAATPPAPAPREEEATPVPDEAPPAVARLGSTMSSAPTAPVPAAPPSGGFARRAAHSEDDGVARPRSSRERDTRLAANRPAGRQVHVPVFRHVHAPEPAPAGVIVGGADRPANEVAQRDASPDGRVEGPRSPPATTIPDPGGSDARAARTPAAEAIAQAEAPDVDTFAGRGRVRVALGGATTPLRLEPDDRTRDADDATAGGDPDRDLHAGALVTLGVLRLPESRRGFLVAADVGAGRMLAMRHPSTVLQAGAELGHTWGFDRARLDLGGHVGVQGFLRASGEAPRGDAPADAQADDGGDPPLAERDAVISVGPVATASFGPNDGPRGTLRVAPLLTLAPGRSPTPWLQLTLGLELPALRGS